MENDGEEDFDNTGMNSRNLPLKIANNPSVLLSSSVKNLPDDNFSKYPITISM